MSKNVNHKEKKQNNKKKTKEITMFLMVLLVRLRLSKESFPSSIYNLELSSESLSQDISGDTCRY